MMCLLNLPHMFIHLDIIIWTKKGFETSYTFINDAFDIQYFQLTHIVHNHFYRNYYSTHPHLDFELSTSWD
jgi:hypothetical protein